MVNKGKAVFALPDDVAVNPIQGITVTAARVDVQKTGQTIVGNVMLAAEFENLPGSICFI